MDERLYKICPAQLTHKIFWTNLVGTYWRQIPTKFEVNLAEGFGDEIENVNYNCNEKLVKIISTQFQHHRRDGFGEAVKNSENAQKVVNKSKKYVAPPIE